jgi:2-polyprenyl-3-methyl-5-hydroxy-6-metoxy-1,4-benzoquinol methylase
MQQNEMEQVNQSIYTAEKRVETYNLQKAELEARYQKRLTEISGFLGRKTGKLLDVGCSIGFFLLTARNLGWQVKGVELNAETGEYARNQFHLDVATGKLEEVNYGTEEFDVITAWDVIEHVPDPVSLLKSARKLLRPDGVLALQIPNMDSVMARYTGPRWYWWSVPDHLSHFTPKSIKKILDISGFELSYLHTWDSPTTVPMNILTALMQVDLDAPPGRWAHLKRKAAILLAELIAPILTIVSAKNGTRNSREIIPVSQNLTN